MSAAPMGRVIKQVRRAVLRQEAMALTDGQLLECFVQCRDEAAFEALVRRHGPMVMGVCGRILQNHHDAQDAFQATFLVLVRKAATVASRELLPSWLYGVAYNTARKAKATIARRRMRERQIKVMPEPATAQPDLWRDVQPVLDTELRGLPAKYRLPVILCDLEGKSHKEAARQLGCPQGTVSGRLARARVMLAKRLARHGLVLSGGALAVALSEGASASVPTLVVASTVNTATLFAIGRAVGAATISSEVVALAEGVLKTMLLTRFKMVLTVALVIAFVGLGGGSVLWRTQAAEDMPRSSRPEEPAKNQDDDLKKTLLELDELWWRGDVETLRKLAADHLVTVSGVGRYDKASLLEAAKHRHAVDGTKREIEVIRVSKDVAVLTYVYDCKVVLTDGTLFQNCRDRRFSLTWAKRKGGWVVVFAQETILPGGE